MTYTWKSKDGRETKVDEMDVTHLANAIAFVRREYSCKVRAYKAQKAVYDAELAEWQEVYDLTADGYPKQRELANKPVEPTKPEEPEALIALEAEAARRFMVRHDHDDLEDLEFHLEDLADAQLARKKPAAKALPPWKDVEIGALWPKPILPPPAPSPNAFRLTFDQSGDVLNVAITPSTDRLQKMCEKAMADLKYMYINRRLDNYLRANLQRSFTRHINNQIASERRENEIKGPPLGLVSKVRTDGLAEVKLFGQTSSIFVEPKKAVAEGAMLHANEVKVGSPRAQSAQAERATWDGLYAAAERYLRTPPFYRGIVAAPDSVAGSIWRKPFEACQSGRTEACFLGGHNED